MSARPEAVIFMGLPAAGKSTLYRERFAATHAHINLDRLHTRAREKALLTACLAAGASFVVDNTNPTLADRARYLKPSLAAGYRAVAYYFKITPEEALRRNAERRGKARVPAVAVRAAWRRLEPPVSAEGWDAMYVVESANGQPPSIAPWTPG